MNKFVRRIGIVLVLGFSPILLNAQFFNDIQGRSGLRLEYHVTRKLRMGGTYYLYLNEHFEKYQQSVFFVFVEYKIKPWIDAGIQYRYGLRNKSSFNEFRYSLNFSPKLNWRKWDLSFRTLVQQRNTAHQSLVFYLRNMVQVIYKISDRLDLLALTENYLKMSDNFNFDTQKNAIGSEMDVGKSGMVRFQVSMKNERENKNLLRFELTYRYILGKK